MPEQVLKFKGGIEVSNIDQVKIYLMQEMRKLFKELRSLQAKNSKDKYPKDIKVNNLGELEQSIKALSDIIRDLPSPEVTVNAPEINVAAPIVNIPDVIVPEITIPSSEVNIDIDKVVKTLKTSLNKLSSNSAGRPLAVRLSDGQGWQKALKDNTDSIANLLGGFTQYQSDTGRVANSKGVRINPATDDIFKKGGMTHVNVSVTSTEAQYSPTGNKRQVLASNNGSKIIYVGGTGVTSSDYAFAIFPRQAYDFNNVNEEFNFYAICSSGNTSTLGVAEYD